MDQKVGLLNSLTGFLSVCVAVEVGPGWPIGFFGDRGQVGTWKSVILLPLGGGSINRLSFRSGCCPGLLELAT